ncbi:MAG TPA: CopG family antitoxin [Xanthobacteraceae bacterium]
MLRPIGGRRKGLSGYEKELAELKTDDGAEAFLEQDAYDLDFPQTKPMRFEFRPKQKSINLRVSEELLQAVRAHAKQQGIPYQRYIRQALERALAQPKR